MREITTNLNAKLMYGTDAFTTENIINYLLYHFMHILHLLQVVIKVT